LQIESQIIEALESGIHVIAEDYTGTGIAWGIGSGVDSEYLFKINSKLLAEDLTILLDGNRFMEARESNHTHESDDELTEKVRQVHLELARERGWNVVNANDSLEVVHENIWNVIRPLLSS
jgi:thymidylate kinase